MELNWKQIDTNASMITTLDAHAAGEPLRIITSVLPTLPGASMLERRRYMQEHLDHVRRALMWEPRGHRDMYGCVLTAPVTPDADLGVLFMHNEGFSTMCGHGTIALVTALVETGAIAATGQQTAINFDTPAGLVRATAHSDESGHVTHVSFRNVPSFLYARDVQIELAPYGRLVLDIAFGGAFYAVVPVEQVGLRVVAGQTQELMTAGEAIKRAVNATLEIRHPIEADLGFLYGTIFTDSPENPAHHSRNVCIFGNAEVDRSPKGTGVSSRLAIHYARGEIVDDQQIIIESILGAGSIFGGRVVGQTQVGGYTAIIPEVSGRAFITGRHEFIIDPRDELGKGFFL